MAKFYLTFGCGIDQPNKNKYVIVEANKYSEARKIIMEYIGWNWSMLYSEKEWYNKNGVSQAQEFNLEEITLFEAKVNINTVNRRS